MTQYTKNDILNFQLKYKNDQDVLDLVAEYDGLMDAESDLEKLQNEYGDLESAVDRKDREISKLEDEVEKLSNQIEDLEKQLEAKEKAA